MNVFCACNFDCVSTEPFRICQTTFTKTTIYKLETPTESPILLDTGLPPPLSHSIKYSLHSLEKLSRLLLVFFKTLTKILKITIVRIFDFLFFIIVMADIVQRLRRHIRSSTMIRINSEKSMTKYNK